MDRELRGYELETTLAKSVNSHVFRARRLEDDRPVVVKMAGNPAASPYRVARLKREFRMTAAVDDPGVIGALAIASVPGGVALVFEDGGGEALSRLDPETLEIDEKLEIAVQLARSLSAVHGARIVHKDVNPSNIVWNRDTRELKLIDFDIATELDREAQQIVEAAKLEGTLSYISPEQTGRTRHAVDFRTDLYSAGATLFWLFTGQHVFESEDALEVVHCHLAQQPRSPAEIASVPAVLSEIILRLLAKSADDRYQSAAGLGRDLEHAQQLLAEHGYLGHFEIGASDRSRRFAIPDRLYGRSQEVNTLKSAFAAAADGRARLLTVSGRTGIGKSALVAELHRPVVEARGAFAVGKFDQFERSVPYAPLRTAFAQLTRWLLAGSEAALRSRRAELVAALGNTAGVLLELAPETEALIGPAPAPIPLPPEEARFRLMETIRTFLFSVAGVGHPVVIFLDDVQWADSATLGALHNVLVEDSSENLLIVVAWRDNEVPSGHPVSTWLRELRSAGVPLDAVHLGPLSKEASRQLIADTLHRPPSEVQVVAHACATRTRGNPLFLARLLKELFDRGTIRFDEASAQWVWDRAGLHAGSLPDDVMALMRAQIQSLPVESVQVLSLAACVGASFELGPVSMAWGRTPFETGRAFWAPIQEGLVVPVGEGYRLVQDGDEHQDQIRGVRMQFIHDRVQQAAQEQLAEEERARTHLRLGLSLLDAVESNDEPRAFFDVARHLHDGADALVDPGTRDRVIDTLAEASVRAVSTSAYDPARSFARRALALLAQVEDPWANAYDRALAAHLAAAEALQRTRDFDEMERVVETVMRRAVEPVDTVRAYEAQMGSLISRSRIQESIDSTCEILNKLGLTIPAHPTEADVMASVQGALEALGDRDLSTLVDLGRCTDRPAAAILSLLARLFPNAYIGRPTLFPIIAASAVTISIRHGNGPASPFGYAGFGVVSVAALGQHQRAYDLGQAAIGLIGHMESNYLEARTRYMCAGFLQHWVEPQRESHAGNLRCLRLALETGDIEFGCWAGVAASMDFLALGMNLRDALEEGDELARIVGRHDQPMQQQHIANCRQGVLQLLEPMGRAERLAGPMHQVAPMEAELEARGDAFGLANLYLAMAAVACHYDDFEHAALLARKASPYLPALAALPGMTALVFYSAVGLLGEGMNADDQARAASLAAAEPLIEMLEGFAGSGPNYIHRHRIACGMHAMLTARWLDALPLLREGATLAGQNGYVQDEAIAWRRLAEVWRQVGEHDVSLGALSQACHRYALWGATGVVAHLESNNPELVEVMSAEETTRDRSKRVTRRSIRTTVSATGTAHGGMAIDLESVLRASQAISSEVHLDDMVVQMMGILRQNAGAERGALLLRDDDEQLVLTALIDDAGETTLPGALLSAGDAPLAEEWVRAVARTGESIVVHDASADPRFAANSWIQIANVRSLLLKPIRAQGKVIGVLYLENNLAPGAFTEHRLEVLELLTGQAAVSLQNARLFEEQRAMAESFSRFVPREFLQALNISSVQDARPGQGVMKEITVLFSDLRNFTQLSARAGAAENFAFLSEYMEAMEPAITRHGGFVDKFIGDAVMALFPGRPETAVDAAIGMHRALAELNARRSDRGEEPLAMGIGIHAGPLMLGTIGSARRMETTVIGETVNLASRIESLTKQMASKILMSTATFEQLTDAEQYTVMQRGAFMLKGFDAPVPLVEVVV